MNEDERKVGIPESITINGVTYSVKDTPELQQFIQSVAKVEKAKLYSQFESMKRQIDALGKVQVLPETSTVQEMLEQVKSTLKEDLRNELPSLLKEVIQPVLTATEQSRLNEIEAFKEKLLKENEGACFPELVEGNTREELLASMEKSKNLRAKYSAPFINPNADTHVTDPLLEKQRAEMMGQQSTPTPAPAPAPAPQAPSTPTVPPAAPRVPSPEASEPTNIKRMSMSEFEKNREQLRAQLEQTYGNGTL